MTSILYEHPLNERLRNYLKLEQLSVQALGCLNDNIANNHTLFFSSLFAIIDTLDRNDIRGDLIKDLEKLQQNMMVWSQTPNIDVDALNNNLKKSVKLASQLKILNNLKQSYQEDKFLLSLKQRFAIQGGYCHFDLPQLTFWLGQTKEKITTDCQYWLSIFQQIIDAVNLILLFIRQRSEFEEITTSNGFYQESGDGLQLLRIKLAQTRPYYPTVSGNHYRYAIRFMQPCDQTGKQYANTAIMFELAKC